MKREEDKHYKYNQSKVKKILKLIKILMYLNINI